MNNPRQIAPANLKLYLPMNEGSGSTLYDRSGSGFNFTGTNLAYATGNIGNCFNISSGKYATYSSSLASIYTTTAVSFSFWFNSANTGLNQAIVHFVNSGGGAIVQISWNSSTAGTMAISYWTGSAYVSATYSVPSALRGKWNLFHFVIDRVTSNKIYIYMNGVQVANPNATANISNAALYMRIGAIYNDATQQTTGMLHSLGVWNTVLSAKQIARHYAQKGGLICG